jgi:hypothetical protein
MNHQSYISHIRAIQANILRSVANEYFRRFNGVSDIQLQRFQNSMEKLRGKEFGGVYCDLWLDAEGEMVARSFEANNAS